VKRSAPRAVDRIWYRGDVKLHVANFDLCAAIGNPLINEIYGILQPEAFAVGATFALTTLRGRDARGTLVALRHLITHLRDTAEGATWFDDVSRHLTDTPRAMLPLLLAFDTVGEEHLFPWPVYQRCYRSTAGTQTMLWTVYQYQATRPECC
jgi:hypothetical protein